MDSTRISIARVLALDVPLTWQDAVAVAQEAAMLSEVTAAMSARPSLVSPESCFITRDGDVELPDTTEHEAPEDVARLLRELLAGRDAPAEVEAVAYSPGARDLSEELATVAIGNRRALIAKLASRALAVADRPAGHLESALPPAPLPVMPPFSTHVTDSAVAHDLPVPRPVLVAPRPLRPPFVATPTPVSVRSAAPAEAAAATADAPAVEPAETRAHEVELRRLRHRSRERERAGGLAAVWRRLMPWVTWRPESPDPRVLGGAAVVIAALVAMVWRSDAPPATAADRRTVTPRAVVTSPDRVETAASAAAAPAARDAATATPATALPPALAPPPATSTLSRPVSPTRPSETPTPVAPSPPPAASRPEVAPASGTIVAPPPSASASPAPAIESRRPSDTASSAPAPRPAGGRATLYSATDASVTPPVMRRQQLPSNLLEPTADVPEDWPFLEIVVDERGAVEAVRLRARSVAPGQTMYRHRMLLAAAKAWQFEPATKDGQPVRYLMRVPLEP